MTTSNNLASENQRLLSRIKALIVLIDSRSDSLYTNNQIVDDHAAIGAHVRHIIEFYVAFLTGLAEGRIDYDDRARNRRLEQSPMSAVDAITKIIEQLKKLSTQIDNSVRVASLLDPEADKVVTLSTLERELQFLHAHSVHHLAIIVMLLKIDGFAIDPDLGKAPSTIRYERQPSLS